MLKYYFGDICLEIAGDFQWKDHFSPFTDEQPYGSTVTLHIRHQNTFVPPLSVVAADSNIEIGTAEDGGWCFSTLDKENFSCIRTDSGYSFLECFIDEHCKDPKQHEENFFQILRLAVECHFAYHGKISLHASCVAYENRALLFTAPSGTGKSTQASLWEKCFSAALISGDRPCIRSNGVETAVYGVPWDGKEQIFRQGCYPAEAVFEVRRAKDNSLRKLSESQSFRLLMKQVFIPAWDDNAKFLVLLSIKSIAKAMPFYRLFCLPDISAAELVKRAIFRKDQTTVKESQVDMQIKDGFILRNVVGEWIVMPKGDNIKNFEGAIVLNEVAAFVWKQLEKPISQEDLLDAILNEYDIDRETASKDISSLIEKLSSQNLLEQGTV